MALLGVRSYDLLQAVAEKKGIALMNMLSARNVFFASLLMLMACGDGANGTSEPSPSSDVSTDTSSLTDVVIDDPDGGPDVLDPTPDTVGPPSPWLQKSLGDGGVITALHFVSLTEAYAVGGSRIIRFNGANWVIWGEPGGPDATLYDVWVNEGSVTVVGSDGLVAQRGVAEMDWTSHETGTSAALRAISGRGSNDVWVVGDAGHIVHYDGDTWSVVHDGSNFDLNAVWVHPLMSGSEGVYAVGNGGRLWSYNGATWETKQIADPQADLQDIWGSGETLVAVGTGATIAYKASATALWKGQVSNDNSDRDILAADGSADGDAWLAGSEGLVLRLEDEKWNVQSLEGPMFVLEDFVGIAVQQTGDLSVGMAVASAGGGLVYDGDGWVDMQTRPNDGLKAIAGSREDGLWAVGGGGMLLRWVNGGWLGLDSGTTADLHDVAIDDSGTAWVVGDDGVLFTVTAAGELSWIDMNLPVMPDLFGVATSGEEVAICGKGGTLWRRSNAEDSFAPVNSGTTSDLRDLVWGGDGALWMVGAFGRVLRGVGSEKPESLATGVSGTLHSIALTPSGALAVGDNGVILELSADSITFASCAFESTDQCEMPGLPLYGVSTGEDVDFAVGWNGTVLRRGADGVFAAEVTGTNAVLDTVWHDALGALVGGRQGAYMERAEAP
jgi:hypothetical protein